MRDCVLKVDVEDVSDMELHMEVERIVVEQFVCHHHQQADMASCSDILVVDSDVAVSRASSSKKSQKKSLKQRYMNGCGNILSLIWHRYKLYVPYGKSTARYNYFSYRVSRIWNALPLDDVDFESVHRFYDSLTAKVLVRYVNSILFITTGNTFLDIAYLQFYCSIFIVSIMYV